jgi:hypothetical protein
VCGRVGGVGGVGVWGHPLRSNIPRSSLCATLDTYNVLWDTLYISTSTMYYISIPDDAYCT